MRGVSNVITVVMAVILAASIMILAFNVLGTAKEGIEGIKGTAKTQQERLAEVQSLSKACSDWIYGGEKYKAKAILETYELPDKMRPYRDARYVCGDELEDLAQECLTQEGEGYGDCAGSGYISASAPIVGTCTRACTRIMQIHETCETACSSRAGICFEELLEQMSPSQLGGRTGITITDSMVERACEG